MNKNSIFLIIFLAVPVVAAPKKVLTQEEKQIKRRLSSEALFKTAQHKRIAHFSDPEHERLAQKHLLSVIRNNDSLLETRARAYLELGDSFLVTEKEDASCALGMLEAGMAMHDSIGRAYQIEINHARMNMVTILFDRLMFKAVTQEEKDAHKDKINNLLTAIFKDFTYNNTFCTPATIQKAFDFTAKHEALLDE